MNRRIFIIIALSLTSFVGSKLVAQIGLCGTIGYDSIPSESIGLDLSVEQARAVLKWRIAYEEHPALSEAYNVCLEERKACFDHYEGIKEE